MNANVTVNRRSFLKKGILAAGGVVGGLAIAPEIFAKPAMGMKALYPSMLAEDFQLSPLVLDVTTARLSANENPFGPSKKAIAAVAESAVRGNRYASGGAKPLLDLLAAKEGVPVSQILLSAGSTDILEKTAFALCMKGGNVISADPSYMSLIRTAQSIGATWKNIPLKADYAHDLDAMEKAIDADTKLIYICNPNNPTGTLTPIADLTAFIKKVNSRVPIFLDEAYLELLDNPDSQTTVGLIKEGYDIIVCRTFSKIHGMAGLRMGYMAAKLDRVQMIQKLVRTEMGISVTALEAATASIKDVEFQNYSRQSIKEGREYTFAELKKKGLNPIPSYTNFILFPVLMPTRDLVSKMAELGVGMRGFEIDGKPYGRISIGTMDEMKLFVKSINTVIS